MLVIYCSAPDYGQGISTVMVQLASEMLGVPRERFRLVNADTLLTPDSGIQGASRATYFIGSAVRHALSNLRDEIFSVASEMLDCSPTVLEFSGESVSCRGTSQRTVSLQDVAREFDVLGKSRRVIGVFDLSPLYPEDQRPEYVPFFTTGAQVAQVRVDLQTGQTEVTRLTAAHDVGHAINPPDAIGQIQGAIVMGIGTVLSEEYVPGVTTGFTDYILPMIGTVPEMEIRLVEVPSRHGPLGAKGLGEAAIMPTAPAVLNAISRAIGVRLRRVPATPPRVLSALRSRA
jgi:CO/xanthine dehydrogenase Mo-binding subunit